MVFLNLWVCKARFCDSSHPVMYNKWMSLLMHYLSPERKPPCSVVIVQGDISTSYF